MTALIFRSERRPAQREALHSSDREGRTQTAHGAFTCSRHRSRLTFPEDHGSGGEAVQRQGAPRVPASRKQEPGEEGRSHDVCSTCSHSLP